MISPKRLAREQEAMRGRPKRYCIHETKVIAGRAKIVEALPGIREKKRIEAERKFEARMRAKIVELDLQVPL
jgi:hypothetical protein